MNKQAKHDAGLAQKQSGGTEALFVSEARECLFRNPRIEWPDISGGMKRKIPYTRIAPKGAFITAFFSDWDDGILSPEVESEIYKRPPSRLAERVCQRYCLKSQHCLRWKEIDHNPVLQIMENLRVYDLWIACENRYLRRAILILAFLGKEGMRPGGYTRPDLRRISGLQSSSRSELKGIVDRLTKMGLVRESRRANKLPRFVLKRVPDATIKRARDEYFRSYLFAMLGSAKGDARSKKFKRYVKYDRVSPGIIVGVQPPEWFVDLLGDFISLLNSTFNYYSQQISWGAELVMDPIMQRGQLPTKGQLSKPIHKFVLPAEDRTKLRTTFQGQIEFILDKHLDLTLKDVVEWLDFCRITLSRVRTSLFLLEIPEMDLNRWEHSGISQQVERLRSFDQWERTRDPPVW
jgi:hypothetical protein